MLQGVSVQRSELRGYALRIPIGLAQPTLVEQEEKEKAMAGWAGEFLSGLGNVVGVQSSLMKTKIKYLSKGQAQAHRALS